MTRKDYWAMAACYALTAAFPLMFIAARHYA